MLGKPSLTPLQALLLNIVQEVTGPYSTAQIAYYISLGLIPHGVVTRVCQLAEGHPELTQATERDLRETIAALRPDCLPLLLTPEGQRWIEIFREAIRGEWAKRLWTTVFGQVLDLFGGGNGHEPLP